MCFTEERSRHYGHGAAQRQDFLHFTRGTDRHRKLATPLQHDQAPRLNRIQATSTRGVRARIRRVAGCATPTGSAGHAGATANLKLTFHLDHSARHSSKPPAAPLGAFPPTSLAPSKVGGSCRPPPRVLPPFEGLNVK